jgi:DNA-binding transcriptional LysR family regulator
MRDHLDEFIERDMIAVRVLPDQRAAIVGSPRYFESHSRPDSPRDLTRHRCLDFRHGSAGVYPWEFDKGKQSLAVAVNGPLTVDDVALMIHAAIDGAGLAYMLEEHAAPHLRAAHWCESSKIGARLSPATSWLRGSPARRNSRESRRNPA